LAVRRGLGTVPTRSVLADPRVAERMGSGLTSPGAFAWTNSCKSSGR
jgi:hypothetical protein